MLSSDAFNYIHHWPELYQMATPTCRGAEDISYCLIKQIATLKKMGFCLKRKKGNMYLQSNIDGRCIPKASQSLKWQANLHHSWCILCTTYSQTSSTS